MLAPGARPGPYEIVSAIGKGGVGEVYLATDTTLKRAAAVKLLLAASVSYLEHLARFREAPCQCRA